MTVAEIEPLTVAEIEPLTTTPHCLLKQKRVPIKLGLFDGND